MKVNTIITTTVFFKEGEREKANAFIDSIIEDVARKGVNIEVAWDTDHVRVTGRCLEEVHHEKYIG